MTDFNVLNHTYWNTLRNSMVVRLTPYKHHLTFPTDGHLLEPVIRSIMHREPLPKSSVLCTTTILSTRELNSPWGSSCKVVPTTDVFRWVGPKIHSTIRFDWTVSSVGRSVGRMVLCVWLPISNGAAWRRWECLECGPVVMSGKGFQRSVRKTGRLVSLVEGFYDFVPSPEEIGIMRR